MENTPPPQKNSGFSVLFLCVENGKEIGQDCLGKRLGLKGKERFQGKKSTWVPIRLLSARTNNT